MSFPPCMFHPAEWVSRTQMAPGVSSLSTTDGTESCLSRKESWIWFGPTGLLAQHSKRGKKNSNKKPSGYTNTSYKPHRYTGSHKGGQMIVKTTDKDTDERFFAGLWKIWRDKSHSKYVTAAFTDMDELLSDDKCQRTVRHESISSGPTSLCRHECQIAAAKWGHPTFNRVDIWKPWGFSVSPPGQMILRWLFITTCSDAAHTHICSVIGECWHKACCWWGSNTVGEHRSWVSFI